MSRCVRTVGGGVLLYQASTAGRRGWYRRHHQAGGRARGVQAEHAAERGVKTRDLKPSQRSEGVAKHF